MGFDAGFGRVLAAPHRILVTSGWGQPRRGHPHWGMDLRAAVGVPIQAAAAGEVIVAKTSDPDGDAGNYVAIRHDTGLVTRYLHLSVVAVNKGQRVARGQHIGKSGRTGIFHSAPHLHFDVLAPAELLPTIIAVTGKPGIGWPSQKMTGLGHFIPGEPWLPVDEYQADVLSYAKKYKIPLYGSVPHGRTGDVGKFVIGLGVAGFISYMLFTRALR